MTSQDPTRREVLAGVCILAAASLVGCSSPSASEAQAGIVERADGKVEVTIAKLSGLKADGNSVTIGLVGGVSAALVRINADTYKAMSLSCTHEGAEIDITQTPWTCPEHGAQFDPLTGEVLRGPAFQSLPELPVSFANGVAVVG